MNKEQARLLFMELMYDEISDQDKEKLIAFLEEHPEMKQELEGLKETQSILQYLPAEEPEEKIVVAPAKTIPLNSWFSNRIVQSMAAAAAVIFLFFSMAALTNFNVQFGDQGFVMAFGSTVDSQQMYSEEQVQNIVDQIQRENVSLMSDLLLASEEQQIDQFEKAMDNMINYINQQREYDLRLINLGLDQIQQNTQSRFREQDLVLNEIIETVSHGN